MTAFTHDADLPLEPNHRAAVLHEIASRVVQRRYSSQKPTTPVTPTVESLLLENEELREDNRQLEQVADDCDRLLDMQTSQFGECAVDFLADLRADNETLRSENADLRDENEELRDDNRQLRRQTLTAFQQAVEAGQEASDLRKENRELRERNAKLFERYNHCGAVEDFLDV
jgi:FtsZ-binding cell division protein ZapB